MRLLLALIAFGGFLLAGCAAQRPSLNIESPYRDLSTLHKGEIVHLATGRLLTEPELFAYLAPYAVVYVGETHDNVEAHAVELAVLKAQAERHPGSVALGLEMLRRPSQAEVDSYIRGELGEKEFQKLWGENWGPRSFPYYQDILHYAREHRIPVLALNAGNELKNAVRDRGFEDLPPEMAARAPERDLSDPYYRAFVQGMFEGHVQGSDQVDAFYRVQVLWDETMAQTAAEYLASREGRGKHLLIFAGGNHVRYGFGIPRRLFRRLPLPYVILEPHIVEMPEEKQEQMMDVELPQFPMRPADVYWAVGYEDLEKDRVMLGVQIEPAQEGGVRVVGVMPGGPAADAGMEAGDVIVAADGVPVKEVFDLTYQVGLHRPGEEGSVEVERKGEHLTLRVSYEVPHQH